MQVLFLPGYSSSNPYLRRLRSHLAEEDVEAVIPDGFSAIPVLGLFSVFPILGSFRRYGTPDVLHLHWLHPFLVPEHRSPLLGPVLAVQFVLEILVAKALGVRIVWTVHNLRDHDRRVERIEIAVRHALVRLADGVVVHGESVVDTVLETYRLPRRMAEKFTVIPHGHYLDDYPNEVSRETAREFVGAGDDETVFVYFGRIRPYKNVPALIETFRELEGDSLKLLVVGNPSDASLAEEIEALAAGDDRVELVLEFVDDEDVQFYMNAADAVVLPFSEILTSGSTILAMSFGRPVIVPDIGCVGELTDHHPGQAELAYDPDRPNGLRDAMAAVPGADTEVIGEANRERTAQLDWASVAERTATVYRGTFPRGTRSVPVSAAAD